MLFFAFKVEVLAASAFVAMAFVAVSAADAESVPIAVECGDTIGPGGSWELSNDVGPCEAGLDAALTIIGPVQLDLAGHRIACVSRRSERCCAPGYSCSPLVPECSPGLVLEGRNVRVADGMIDGCYDGVVLGGVGRHQVRRMEARGLGSGIAYHVQSDGNLLADCVAVDCDECFGFRVSGDRNRLRGNTATTTPERESSRDIRAAMLVDGDRNVLLLNQAHAWEGGLWIGGNDNLIKRNRVSGYGGAISVAGTGNRVTRNDTYSSKGVAIGLGGRRNIAVGNVAGRGNDGCAVRLSGQSNTSRRTHAVGEFPFCVDGHSHRLDRNVAMDADGIGYDIRGSGHFLRGNRSGGRANAEAGTGFLIRGQLVAMVGNVALGHGRSGFHVVEGAFGNLFEANTALDNNLEGSSDQFDLRDDNPGCGTNRWVRSEFGTRNQDCIGGRER